LSFSASELLPPPGGQQVEDLLAFLQRLSRVLEVGDDLLDRLLHPVELAERRVDADDLVGKDARQARVVARVDILGLADRHEHALGGGGVGGGVRPAELEILAERILLLEAALVARLEAGENPAAALVTAFGPGALGDCAARLAKSRENLRRVSFHASLRCEESALSICFALSAHVGTCSDFRA